MAAAAGFTALAAGCGNEVQDNREGLGDPCIISEESDPEFAGFGLSGITIESGAAQCQTGYCLAYHFQGRVSCPAGQDEPTPCDSEGACPSGTSCRGGVCEPTDSTVGCHTPGSGELVSTSVCGQCSTRPPEQAVYCSCRCGLAEGQPPEEAENLCDCPDGFGCEEIRPYLGPGWDSHAGKYCIKQGTDNYSYCGRVEGHWDPTCNGSPPADDSSPEE